MGNDAQRRAAFTYNAAADFYDASPLGFWNYFGRRTVERLSLQSGARVLDACCGAGASALSAAEIIGLKGKVIGVDLAQGLLELAQGKAAQRRLGNTQFERGDLLSLRFPNESFDAAVCVFGIFFVPDMAAAVQELWRCVRPGGQLAVTTWGPNLFEPGNGAFWASIKDVRADLYKGFNPWDRISDPASLRALLRNGGIERAEVVAEAGTHLIPSAGAWWSAVLGSGYRGTVDQLDAAALKRVYEANVSYIQASGISSVEANVLYAIAQK